MSKMTMQQKIATRAHMRDNGLDPYDMSQAAFIAYANKHGLTDAKTPKEPKSAPAPAPKEPKSQPAPAPAPANDVGAAVSAAIQAALSQFTAPAAIDPALIEAAVQRHCAHTVTIEHKHGAALPESVKVEGAHCQLHELLTCLQAGLHVYVWGEAGSGKTHMAQQAAKALEVGFYFTGKIDEVFDLVGFRDATGNYAPTEFYTWCLNGGVLLFDEADGSSPQALTRFNAATSNGYMDFPTGRVELHEDCYVIMAGNTSGDGGNYRYLRNKLDAATMDRVAVIKIEYDLALERRLALAENPDAGDWVDFVQATRKKADALEMPILITPRASINGAKLLRAEMPLKQVKLLTVFKGASIDTINALRV